MSYNQHQWIMKNSDHSLVGSFQILSNKQWGVALDCFHMKRHLKSRNPALNVPRKHEPVSTDTIFSDTPAVDSGVKQAQVFVGRDSLVADVYPMKSGKQFVNTLEDNIRRIGAMEKLLSDSAKTEISKKVNGYFESISHLQLALRTIPPKSKSS